MSLYNARKDPISSFYKLKFPTFWDICGQLQITANPCQSLFSAYNEAISALVKGTTISVGSIPVN